MDGWKSKVRERRLLGLAEMEGWESMVESERKRAGGGLDLEGSVGRRGMGGDLEGSEG